jgi:ATP-dependent protease ClpP protease subunit
MSTSASAQSTGAAPSSRNFDYKNGRYHLTYHDLPDSQVITYSGEILMQTPQNGLSLLAQSIVPNKPIIFLISTSGGGVHSTYQKFESILRGACPKENCHITTYVYDLCASACVELSMVGDHRVVARRALFGFHRTYVGFGPFTTVIQSKKKFIAMYVGLGVDPEWMNKNVDELISDQKDCVWVSVVDLKNARFADEIDLDESYFNQFRSVVPEDFYQLYSPGAKPTYFQSSIELNDGTV